MNRIASALVAVAIAALPAIASAQDGAAVKKIFAEKMPNVPGKTMSAIVVDYAPGGGSKSHHHAKSGFIYAHVLSGAIRSQVEGEPAAKVYTVGQFWTEGPGAHHVVSENASKTKPARLLAIIVADEGDTLTTFDK